MFSKFFIERPIFAAVISIIIVIAGIVTLLALPIAQYPDIAPPTVVVSASYPGANAQVVSETVASPIEQEVNGVEGMLYMESLSSSDGSYQLTITFETGVDVDMATVLVQNRVSIAAPKLPEEVTRMGVTTQKQSPDFVLMIGLISKGGKYDDVYLANYATLHLRDPLSRVPGVGAVNIMGASNYSMRVWLNPEKMKARKLTTGDILNAIQEQNVQVAAGIVGQPPAPKGQNFQYTVTTLGRLEDVGQFENIIVKTDGNRITRVKDLARVELGAQTYGTYSELNSEPTTMVAVYQLPGANVLQVSEKSKALFEQLKQDFPESLDYVVAYDASNVVNASVQEIVITLIIAAILVILTVFVFLQDLRATIIPSITIPVSLIGTFLIMEVLGFTLNTLTLFGLVLAIGIVVDDAIVVVENTARHIDESGLPARQAAVIAMQEVTGPVVATTLVLLAVFVPTAFTGGMTGILFKQFALTIAAATLFSSINALTLSPSLCALVLRPTPQRRNVFFRWFNIGFEKGTNLYMSIVGHAVRKLSIFMILYVGFLAGTYFGAINLPTAFVPEEDQGYGIVNVMLPDGASLERTRGVMSEINKIIDNTPGVEHNIAIGGYSILDGTAKSNVGSNVVVYKPWDERKEPGVSQDAIIMNLRKGFHGIRDAIAVAFMTPPLPGLGMAGGFEMQLQDRGGGGLQLLERAAQEIVQSGNTQTGLTGMYTSFRANVPQLFVEVDRTKVKSLGVPMSTVFGTLQAYLGSAYANDFNKFGRTYQVNVQAESAFRAHPSAIARLDVRNAKGDMLPLGTLIKVRDDFGPQVVTRFNMFPSAKVMGSAAPGFSSGQALEIVSDLADQKMPASMGYEWSGISYQETAGSQAGGMIMILAVVFVYLVLAAQYESWRIPFGVILSVPLGLFGALMALLVLGMDLNVYTQIGLVLLIALASKNAILIVEFAKEAEERKGMSPVEAALEACRLRFRPILMTAFSFILGVLPLLLATGAGAGSRKALGTAVFYGMLAATMFGVVFVPTFYVAIEKLAGMGKKKKDGMGGTPPADTAA